MTQWALGFLAGVSDVARRDLLDGTDVQGVLGWLDHYCWQRPTDRFVNALEAFVNERLQ
jgi:hypothetical protein